MEDKKNIMALLEATLVEVEQPDYLEVTDNGDFIYVLVSKISYKQIPMLERIQRITTILEFDHEDILKQYPVIVECLDDDELTGLFELYGKKRS